MSTPTPQHIVLVEDDPSNREAFARILRRAGYRVSAFESADEGIDLAVAAEHGFGHTASMFSRNIDNLSRMAREMNTSIYIKNGPNLAGLGYGGEGYTSFSIASPTGEGLTNALTFTRVRRCTMVDHFRIV